MLLFLFGLSVIAAPVFNPLNFSCEEVESANLLLCSCPNDFKSDLYHSYDSDDILEYSDLYQSYDFDDILDYVTFDCSDFEGFPSVEKKCICRYDEYDEFEYKNINFELWLDGITIIT